MKKIIGTAISLFFMLGTASARGIYFGDVQLHFGTGIDIAEIEQSKSVLNYTN